MTHEPTKRIQRQREARRAVRQRERHAANAHLRAAVRALGAGEPEDWGMDGCEGLSPVTGQKTGVCDDD